MDVMRAHPYVRDTAMIGAVAADHPGMVTIRSPFGIKRIVEMLASDQFPRIC